jgi:hypothetical protein
MNFDDLRCLLWKEKEEFEPVLCVGAGRLVTASISDSRGFGVRERGPIKDSV